MNPPFLRRWLIGSAAAGIVFFTAHGIAFDSLYAAGMIVLIIGLINAFLPQLISMMSFVRTILTLGLAMLVANALVLHVMQEAGLGIRFRSFDAMFLAAITISVIAWFTTVAMDTPLKNQP